MKLSEFSYDLPADLIAQTPLTKRDESRLMIVRRESGQIEHDQFKNIGKYLPPESLIVLNNTKVIPARLFGTKVRTGGRVEIFLLKKLSDGFSYETLLKPRGRIAEGETITFENEKIVATVTDKAQRIVRFSQSDLAGFLKRQGHVPLPPYIKREDTVADREDYQTVYARHPGSVAAPTAGLHFTRPLLAKLKKQGHDFVTVTLHVNLATFKPVVEEDITRHDMHSEEYSVTPLAWKKIMSAKSSQRPIIGVGTTSCRTLEAVATNGKIEGETRIFIYPGYEFNMVNAMITNFHLPKSTLLMLVYAFGGKEILARAYQEAIAKRYRFFSYGDAMLIL